MPFFDFLKNFFGNNNSKSPYDESEDFGQNRDSFRNPIWQNDDDDDDEDDFRRAHRGMYFGMLNDPLELARYFETEMDGMLHNFFHGFGQNIHIFGGHQFPRVLPPDIHTRRNDSLRDEVLKPNCGEPFCERGRPKMDEDLDGKINADQFLKAWDDSNQEIQPRGDFFLRSPVPYRGGPFTSSGQSIRTQVIRKADGTIEQQKIIKNSDGSEETTISKQVGDKKYTVITRRDKDGVETKTEDLVNMDENDIKNFNRNWTVVEPPDLSEHRSIFDYLPWDKFFGPYPKL